MTGLGTTTPIPLTHPSAIQLPYALDGSNTAATGFQPSALGNPNVTWETTTTMNVGLDGML